VDVFGNKLTGFRGGEGSIYARKKSWAVKLVKYCVVSEHSESVIDSGRGSICGKKILICEIWREIFYRSGSASYF
jgi:hypothetical protein